MEKGKQNVKRLYHLTILSQKNHFNREGPKAARQHQTLSHLTHGPLTSPIWNFAATTRNIKHDIELRTTNNKTIGSNININNETIRTFFFLANISTQTL